MEYYCSEKFRVNANQVRVDIWLIYKCSKCDSTWKLTIKKGIKPRDLAPGLFERFVSNDKCLAWQYAFDRHFLKQNTCVVDYTSVNYSIDGIKTDVKTLDGPLLVHLKSPYTFDLKLSAMLAKALSSSVGQIKKLAHSKAISVDSGDIMKLRIRADIDILFEAGITLTPPPTEADPQA